MSIIQMSLPIPSSSSRNLSSFRVLSDPEQLNLFSKFSQLSIRKVVPYRGSTVIRMGGGPRTFPGGVSKWQWKRMQAKKQKQLLKARLLRERQIYEMRKRSELRAAVSELERPWEVVERAPTLFSVKADEQLKVLADRFHKPGGYDLWSERDGPQVFHTVDGLPSARFFPKGVVHSVKPYESVRDSDELDSSEASMELGLLGYDVEDGSVGERGRGSSESWKSRKLSNWMSKGWTDSGDEDEDEVLRGTYSKNSRSLGSRGKRVGDVKRLGSANGRELSRDFNGGRGGKGSPSGGLRRNGTRQNVGSDSEGRNEVPFDRRGRYDSNRPRQSIESRDSNWLSSGKANSDREGRNEVSFDRRGRYDSNRPRQSIESRDSNRLIQEKSNFDRRGRYGNNRPRQSNESRDSNRLSQEKSNFDRRGRYGNNRPRQGTESRDLNRLSSEKANFDRGGRNEVPLERRGRYGSSQRSSAGNVSSKSSVSKGREVYDMSLKGGGSYEFQETEQ